MNASSLVQKGRVCVLKVEAAAPSRAKTSISPASINYARGSSSSSGEKCWPESDEMRHSFLQQTRFRHQLFEEVLTKHQ